MAKMLKKVMAAMMLVALMMGGVSAMAENIPSSETQAVETAAKKFKGSAKVKLVNKGKLFYGDEITLKAVVKVNAKDYSIQWQMREKKSDDWTDIKGATKKTYKFTVTPENQDWQYRVMVTAA